MQAVNGRVHDNDSSAAILSFCSLRGNDEVI